LSKPLPIVPPRQPTQEEAEQQLNQLLSEIRILESYYNEIVARIQAASAGLSDIRLSVRSVEALAENQGKEFLLPIGGGLLLPSEKVNSKKLIVNVGGGVLMEKNLDSAKAFLITREKELESAMNSLEKQRREIASRLETGRNILQQITGQT
jgi:prefoldin alpha subunit